MGKVIDQIAEISRRRQADYEKCSAFEEQYLERGRLITDEVTEASEKLAVPMHNSFEYELKSDGELWFQNQAIGPILDKSIDEAELVARKYPHFAVELARRIIERQEYDDQRKLALGGSGDADVLLVLSPIPDAALSGVELGAYDLERRVTMVRIYERSDTGIKASSLSLDLSDRDGLEAIASRFGQRIEEGESSEEILSRRFWINSSSLDSQSVAQTVRRTYDEILAEKFGGDWYAGRQNTVFHDAMAFIEQQQDIVNEHIDVMEAIRLEPDERVRDDLAKAARYNFAAALDIRLKGRDDVAGFDGSILAGAGSAAKAEGVEYRSSCPNGAGLTAEDVLGELKFGNVLTYGECRVCLRKIMVGECSVCMACEEADNQGKDLGMINRRALAKRRRTQNSSLYAHSTHEKPSSPNKLLDVKQKRQIGENAMIKSRLVIGGTVETIVDQRTGEMLRLR